MDDLERVLADGQERLTELILRAQRLNDEWAATVAEVERVRADIERRTGVSLIRPAPVQAMADVEFESLVAAAWPDGVSE